VRPEKKSHVEQGMSGGAGPRTMRANDDNWRLHAHAFFETSFLHILKCSKTVVYQHSAKTIGLEL
jgi:hypothetical protein